MTEEEFLDDLWNAIIEMDKIDDLQPGELTVRMYAEKIGRTADNAREILNRHVAEGRMTKRTIYTGRGAGMLAFKPVGKA